MDLQQLGVFGEKIAENYLKKKGYKILDKNYFFKSALRQKKAEIDIVAQKEDVISFVEVKTSYYTNHKIRRPLKFMIDAFPPEERVNFQKQKKIIKAAESWLVKKRLSLDSKWQIDVVAIKLDLEKKKARLSHFKNITC